MKVFLYIRVACADQLAAASQREELERYAKDKDYEVAAAVAADGISGVHTEGIMNFLLNEAKRQGIGTILTRDTSRISRDASSFMRFERKFKENGIRFEYLSKPDIVSQHVFNPDFLLPGKLFRNGYPFWKRPS
jgi:DNA invertase Pin-like site-specific DNA recombinase